MGNDRRRITEIPEAELVRLYCDQRLSALDIARQLGWSAASIENRLEQLGIPRRLPWAHNAVDCAIEKITRLYIDDGLSLNAVAARLGCSERTVRRKLAEAGVARREDGSEPRYARADFSGNLVEKAYLIGFRIGDLHVATHGRSIVIKCTSTRDEQIALFRTLFERYGHVFTDEATVTRRQRQSIGMIARLNLTFDFLLPKQDAVPEWILASDEPFFAFLAGYIDAEGYFRTYVTPKQPIPRARLEVRSYDAVLLTQLGDGLNARGIRCTPARLRVRAGYTNRYGVRSNRDLWGLGVHRRDALQRLITLIEPHVRHPRRRRDMLAVLATSSKPTRGNFSN